MVRLIRQFLPVFAVVLLFAFSGCAQQGNTEEHPFGGKPGGAEQAFANGSSNQFPPSQNQFPPSQNQPSQQNQPPPNQFPPSQNQLPPSQNQFPPQNQNNPPSLQEQVLRFVNPNASLPSPPEGFPESKLITKMLGDVEIKYFTTAITRGLMESGTDYFITIKNTGANTQTVSITNYGELREKFVPAWNLHFFSLQNSPIQLLAGEEKKLWYFASLDKTGNFTVNFTIWLGSQENPTAEITLPVVFASTEERFWGMDTSYIYGTIKDEEGNPIPNARAIAITGCGRANFEGESDAKGEYFIPLPGMEDIDAIYLGRELACDSKDYWVSLEEEGYEYYYYNSISPSRGKPSNLNITLKKKGESLNYSLEWEKQVSDNYGFFWVKPSEDWSVFAAVQGKHPPMLGKPTNFYLLDAQGNILWKQPTEDECWSIDIKKDGSEAVAGCHDGKVYAVNKEGSLLWSFDTGGMVRSACFSQDGSKILSGAMNPLYLFNSITGTRQEISWNGDWLRNCAFYPDGSGFVVGSRETAGFDSSGKELWRNIIGEFPMFLGVDNEKNTYATGKVRTFFSFNSSGGLRWKHKINEPSATAGALTPDGNRITLGSVGGSVYLYNKEGTLLWRRGTMEVGNPGAVGHNAMAISQDGKIILAGTAPSNCIIAYNENGTQIWKNCLSPDASNPELLLGVNNLQISKDKKKIIASYGDNYIRMFKLDE